MARPGDTRGRLTWAVLAVLWLQPPLAANLSDGGHEARVVEILGQQEPRPTSAEMTAELKRLGPRALPVLIDLFTAGRFPEEAGCLPDELEERQRSALLGAIESRPLAELREALRLLALSDATPEERAVALPLLGHQGTSADVELVVLLANPEAGKIERDGSGAVPFALREACAEALGSILERHPTANRALRESYAEAHDGIAAIIVRLLGERGASEALDSLPLLLGQKPQLDGFLLREISLRGSDLGARAPEETRRCVRRYFDARDPMIQRQAVATAGSLLDDEAVEALVGLLRSSEQNARQSAHLALERITGLGVRCEPRLWEAWYQHESDWWYMESEALVQVMRFGKSAQVAEALKSASRRKLNRDELAVTLAEGLSRTEPEVLVMSCSALGQLGSHVVVEDLVGLLDHRDSRVRNAAWQSLRRITGRSLGPDPELWRAIEG